MANVFVSHRTKDAVEADRLATELKNAGHTVWLDTWELNLGDSIIEKINMGLEGSSYVILCYSSSGVSSPWMTREWASSLARQLEGAGVKILPVMLTGGKPPAILADIKYADLASDWANQMRELLRALRGRFRSIFHARRATISLIIAT